MTSSDMYFPPSPSSNHSQDKAHHPYPKSAYLSRSRQKIKPPQAPANPTLTPNPPHSRFHLTPSVKLQKCVKLFKVLYKRSQLLENACIVLSILI